MQSETKRQIEHMIPVGFALLLRWIPLWAALLLAAVSVVYGGMVSPRLFRRTLRKDEQTLGYAPGKIIYGSVVFLLVLIFREPMFYIVAGAWALLGIGDGMSNIIGRKFGRTRVPWNREKTWEGFAAFVVFGGLAAGFLIWWVALGKNTGAFTPERALLLGVTAAVAAGLIETVRVPNVDDNISVPAVGAAVLYLCTAGLSMSPMMSLTLALVLNFALGLLAFRAGAVSRSGLAGGLVIGAIVAVSLGLPGFLLLALMFLVGSGATRWGYSRKKEKGIAQESGGRRGAIHAAANCIVPVICVVLAAFDVANASGILLVGFAAALATAAMDTVSSELGPLYGQLAVLLPTFRRVKPGTEGAVSLEGTLLGLTAAGLMSLAAFVLGLIPSSACWVVLVAALVGTTLESLLGARGIGKTPGANAALNLINTATGAAVAMILGGIL